MTTCVQARADYELAHNPSAAERACAEWAQQNTKRCPGCNTSIEKNAGCNHMTCSRCRHEFCWLCMRDWHLRLCTFDRCSAPVQQAPRQNFNIGNGGVHRQLYGTE